jgi:putative oxidoreductase
MAALFLVGRIIFGGYFLYNAYGHFKNLAGMTAYVQSKGISRAKAAVIVGGVMLAIGGLSIILGLFIVLGMWLLVLFLIPVTFKMHAFWKETEPMAKMSETVQFTKNLALIGSLLMISSLFVLLT